MAGAATHVDTVTLSNQAIVRRFVEEVLDQNDTMLVDELVAANHVSHCPDGDLYGAEGVRLDIAELRTAFPDLRVELVDLMAEGDRVARRFVLRGTHLGVYRGVPPTGQVVALPGIAIDRLASGRLVESWISLDTLSLDHCSPTESLCGQP